MTFMISIGKYGGFYIMDKTSFRICLGWITFTWLPVDIDDFIKSLTDKIDRFSSATKAVLDCPYHIDEATVPKAGIDSAPEQVVGTMSVSLVKRRALQSALKGK